MAVATVLAGPGVVLAWSAAVVAALILALWALSVRIKDVSIIDPAWGPLFVLVALVAALAGDGNATRRWLLAALTAVWGLRLGLHLLRRKLAEPEEDRRYARMRKREGSRFALWSLGWIFGFQGLLVLIVSLPITVSSDRPEAIGAASIAGFVLFAIGLAFEAIGDEQLTRFKADPASKGQVMDRGLWRYTRHPNYFGDACVWWGLWLVVVPAAGVWWTAVGPVVMTVLLTRVSGKPILERDLAKRRPGYADYIARTAGFIPRPPRPPHRTP